VGGDLQGGAIDTVAVCRRRYEVDLSEIRSRVQLTVASLLGITLVQQMTYRGDNTEEWSNTYHFRNAPPSDDAGWLTVITNLANHVKTVLPDTGKIIRAYGYDTDDDKPVTVFVHDFLQAGTAIDGTYAPTGTDFPMAGDQAAFSWWKINKRNSRGKWIYLRKYWHDGFCDFANPDLLGPAYAAALEALTLELDEGGGAFQGGIRARKHSDAVFGHGVSPYTTTRTLKRRGKRPLASA
jgi:hypothetical protein